MLPGMWYNSLYEWGYFVNVLYRGELLEMVTLPRQWRNRDHQRTEKHPSVYICIHEVSRLKGNTDTASL